MILSKMCNFEQQHTTYEALSKLLPISRYSIDISVILIDFFFIDYHILISCRDGHTSKISTIYCDIFNTTNYWLLVIRANYQLSRELNKSINRYKNLYQITYKNLLE